MTSRARSVLLNRPVFTQQRFSSSSLTVLTTLVHRFAEPGTYQLTVTGGGRTRSDTIRVVEGAAVLQVNVDMAKPGNGPGRGSSSGCCCEPAAGRELAPGGVAAFYASSGAGAYEVTISHLGDAEKRVVLANAEAVPAGDLFAVTLVRPGTYSLRDESGGAGAEVTVWIPEGRRIRTEHVELLRLGEGGFEPGSVRLHAGQSVIVECGVAARLLVELKDPEATALPTKAGRYSVRRGSSRRGGAAG